MVHRILVLCTKNPWAYVGLSFEELLWCFLKSGYSRRSRCLDLPKYVQMKIWLCIIFVSLQDSKNPLFGRDLGLLTVTDVTAISRMSHAACSPYLTGSGDESRYNKCLGILFLYAALCNPHSQWEKAELSGHTISLNYRGRESGSLYCLLVFFQIIGLPKCVCGTFELLRRNSL